MGAVQGLYSQQSHWFVQGNVAAAWSTTDVKNQTELGFGLAVGYTFLLDPERTIGFEARLSYFKACWHGQDYKITPLNQLPGSYSGPLVDYKNGLGYTVNNFQNDAHEYGFQVGAHFNRIREKIKLDPYIFGGIGLVWNQAKGDLYRLVGSKTTYNYDTIELSEHGMEYTLDGVSETYLEGSENGTRIQFMPSLGIGFIYTPNKIISIGLEHKTIFTLRDDFDGFKVEEDRLGKSSNDLVHYTGAILRLNFAHKDQ